MGSCYSCSDHPTDPAKVAKQGARQAEKAHAVADTTAAENSKAVQDCNDAVSSTTAASLVDVPEGKVGTPIKQVLCEVSENQCHSWETATTCKPLLASNTEIPQCAQVLQNARDTAGTACSDLKRRNMWYCKQLVHVLSVV